MPATVHSPARRRPLACVRCRKVRCDGGTPACSNCARAGVECFEGTPGSAVARSRLQYLENRVRELEQIEPTASPRPQQQHTNSPPTQLAHHGFRHHHHSINVNDPQSPLGRTTQTHITSGASPAVSASSRITRDQPLAHEVGLLSLTNASDPKYLGPSSGITFARLIYESVPQSQGLPLAYARQNQHEQGLNVPARSPVPSEVVQVDLPSMAECQQYAETYFAASTFYPFISQDVFYTLLGEVFRLNKTSTWESRLPVKLALAQVFLVLSLGARFLETKLAGDFGSRKLFTAGMGYGTQIQLHDSIEGVQILLLLVQHSFYSPEGLNAWYLLHTIIASCLDLGLQRRDNNNKEKESLNQRNIRHLRSAIFWSAYSMDRTLTTILGRPLTLRDEALDREFPGFDDNAEVEEAAIHWGRKGHYENAAPIGPAPLTSYAACVYSLRFDRIIAEIKLMLYRVSRSPSRFPWPTDVSAWQQEAQRACIVLLKEVQDQQPGRLPRGSGPLSGVTVQRLELKYHQCIMLLYRPSPQILRPSLNAIQACFTSAMKTIAIHADLHRFSNMECSWLSAHSIFVASITVLYCVWTTPAVRGTTPMDVCIKRAEVALQLLSFLGQTWTVAQEAGQKLAKLINSTKEAHDAVPASVSTSGHQPDSNTSIRNDPTISAQRSSVDGTYPDQGESSIPPVDGKSFLIDELGILRDLFDLGWLDDVSDGNQSFFGAEMDVS
ncbi:transcription factor domain-containing protein [Aspergillus alliaceus]|uniref:transcription factor domain-containing protein n=1 Tax=Petromyces alliaceus TaxID=209559 RepID=UPI0012A3C252|nr:fungal-specific transcription factor domain-containing protein [Aspergillus alliaceus]KAB8231324.1 fungal-specific transcription factor domain-containing protein [Aspergillus alliaceus]